MPYIAKVSPFDLISRMRAGFAIVMADSRVSYSNTACAEMLGWESSLVGRHTGEFFDEQNLHAYDAVRDELRGGALGGSYLLEVRGRGGRQTSLLVNSTSMFEVVGGSFLGGIVTTKPAGPAKHRNEEAIEFHLAAARPAAAILSASIESQSVLRGEPSEGEPRESQPADILDLSSLSPREIEMVQRLAHGECPNAIAASCYISRHTVRNHFKSIFRKLGVHSQLELLTKLRLLR